ncbi:nuclear transport factor 2 family protein [Shinella curvata]|uniref:Nuclear transport factor 2 family protein n=1 Tax=Shinella curvata TaxID=1817964 RepID=A0ABT8XBX5_9HYPH|nr:nuclear transport factor 2 family protein [Shinella curvata]MCJ8054849.1 nuclear transport factor 2 family protein [Shinella curvata]MDO6120755.1 nuclear transport factor 2 family protein [Shinella curvata]
MTDMESTVLAAADALVGAFSRHDRNAYFAAFAPEATFLFHNLDHTLNDRAAYEAVWALWEEQDGFRVLACRSTDRKVQLVGDVAIFTHSVETDVSVGGETVKNNERETIVFARNTAGRWLAVHEHLSASA